MTLVLVNAGLGAYHLAEHRKGDFVGDAEIILTII